MIKRSLYLCFFAAVCLLCACSGSKKESETPRGEAPKDFNMAISRRRSRTSITKALEMFTAATRTIKSMIRAVISADW